MRVLLVDVNCKLTSTGKIVYDLYTCLRADGHEASICYGRGPLVDEPGIYKIAGRAEVYLHALLTRLTGFTSCFSPVATRRLIRYIHAFKPDIVHLHDIHGYFLNVNAVLAYLKRSRIKTVLTLHCEYMYTGKCGYSYECDGWKHGCGNCPDKRGYPRSLFFDQTRVMFCARQKIYDGFDELTVVSVSEWLGARARISMLKDKRHAVVYNGIDTRVFLPWDATELRALHNVGDKRAVLHVTGNFEDARKGGRYVLELARHMEDVLFFIVGNNEPISDLPGNVVAIGRLSDQKELARYYSMCDVFLLTSERECLPTVCLEALCCGTPVVGFEGGGAAETAPDGYGKFVGYGDVFALEEALREALNSAANKEEACAAYGAVHYSTERMYRDYALLYGMGRETE